MRLQLALECQYSAAKLPYIDAAMAIARSGQGMLHQCQRIPFAWLAQALYQMVLNLCKYPKIHHG